jgi:tol-pal system protein YbgF
MMRKRLLFSALALAAALASAPAQAQLFGPSDEERAREADQDSQLQQLTGDSRQINARMQVLEDKVRSLTDSLARATGANEELNHRIELLNTRIAREQQDFAYRLCTLSAQQLGAGEDSGLNCAAAGTPSAGAAPAPAAPQSYTPGASLLPLGGGANMGSGPSGGDSDTSDSGDNTRFDPTPGRGRPSGVLGTLPAGSSYAAGAPARLAPPPDSAAPASGGSAQFNSAMNLLARAQYAEASAAFRAYADANPGDSELTPQAVYWIGDIGYVQHDYPNAARSFAEVIKKYPKSARAPDAMLKLGQSLLAMGQKSEGCTTLGALKSKFPGASESTLSAASAARRTACR